MVNEVIERETFVGLRSPPRSIELFFVVKVINKEIANEMMKDSYGHIIAKGEPYLTVVYLEFKSQSRKNVQFGMSRNLTPAYIHIGEVFVTNIQMDENLSMDIQEYRLLCQELF